MNNYIFNSINISNQHLSSVNFNKMPRSAPLPYVHAEIVIHRPAPGPRNPLWGQNGRYEDFAEFLQHNPALHATVCVIAGPPGLVLTVVAGATAVAVAPVVFPVWMICRKLRKTSKVSAKSSTA